jgi:HK97 family phage prohead protease
MNRAYSLLTIKAADDDARVIEGVASTPTPDRMNDVVEPLGAKFALPLPLLLRHNSDTPVGEVTFAKPRKDGIPFKARLTKPTADMPASLIERLNLAWAEVKAKLIRGVSIGFRPLEHAYIEGTGGIRFTSWEWLELSLVTIPANQEATISTIKSIDAQQRRAALGPRAGAARDDSTPAGAAAPRPKGTTMKTFQQQLEELEAKRGEHVARMKQLTEAADGDVTALEADDAKEFDEISAELRTVDASIARVKSAIAASGDATEIPTSGGAAPASRARQSMPATPKEKEDPERKGIAYAQFVRIMYHAKGMPIIAQQLAQTSKFRRGMDPKVPMLIKAAVEAGSVSGTGTDGNWGMELVGDETGAVADFAEFLRKETILGRFGQNGIPELNRVPFRVPLLTQGTGATASWVGEGKAKPLTRMGFSRTTLEPLKIATIAAVTKELLADSSPAADMMLRNELAAAVRERSDIDFIDPSVTATPGVRPASITNGVSGIPATGTGDAADVRTDIRALFAAFRAANNPPRSGVWIMNSNTAIALGLMTNALGQAEFPGIDANGGRLLGMPIIVSDHVPADTNGHIVVLLNAQDVYYADDGGVTVDTSEHASLEMSDAPSHDSVTPTAASLVSMWQTNSVAFRAEQRLNYMRRRASGVQMITGANWGEA